MKIANLLKRPISKAIKLKSINYVGLSPSIFLKNFFQLLIIFFEDTGFETDPNKPFEKMKNMNLSNIQLLDIQLLVYK